MKNLTKILLSLFVLSGIKPGTDVLAQTSDTTTLSAQVSDTTFLPSRGNHVFTSISSVEDPFVSTKFLLNLGMAELLEVEVPIKLGELDTTLMFQPEIFYATAGADFQFEIRDWAAVFIKMYGLARMGNNLLSLASEGVSSASTFNIGWLFRIAENENLMFSGTIALTTADLTFMDILADEDTVITSIDTLVNREVFKSYQSLTTTTDLRFAMKFSDVVGMLAKLEGAYGEFYAGESEGSFQYNLGLVFSFDLRNWIGIPFGIGIGGSMFSNEWRYNEAKPPVYSASLNIAFYNRNDFTFGIENQLQIIEPQQYEQTLSIMYSRFFMSYYF